MVEEVVLAPVACQPSLPLTTFGVPPDALGVSPNTLRAAVARSAEVPLLCYRFEGDTISGFSILQRFELLEWKLLKDTAPMFVVRGSRPIAPV